MKKTAFLYSLDPEEGRNFCWDIVLEFRDPILMGTGFDKHARWKRAVYRDCLLSWQLTDVMAEIEITPEPVTQ